MKDRTLLISTLGTWSLVPEIIGFTNYQRFDLYRNSLDRDKFIRLIKDNNVTPVGELWLISSDSEVLEDSKNKIENWIYHTQLDINTRYFVLRGVSDLETQEDCLFFKDLIYQVVYFAITKGGFDRVYLSLAGGRKTMSSYLQSAGMLFGYDIMFHVLQKRGGRSEIEFLENFNFESSLPDNVVDLVLPVIVDVNKEIDPAIYIGKDSLANKLKLQVHKKLNRVESSVNFLETVESIRNESSFLLYNYTRQIQSLGNSIFYALNFLHPELLERIKKIRLGLEEDIDSHYLEKFLRKLPKAELHFHFGGFADIQELIRIAKANIGKIEYYKLKFPAYEVWLKKIRRCVFGNGNEEEKLKCLSSFIPDDTRKLRNKFAGIKEPYVIAGMILQFEKIPSLLEKFIFGSCLDEKNYCGIGIERYERFGDLQGSGILQSEESIREACRVLIGKCEEHNVKYLELRCSPNNYTRGGLTGEEVLKIIRDELGKSEKTIFNLIIIGSRHNDINLLRGHISLAKKFIVENRVNGKVEYPAIVGFDLAGNEEGGRAREFREEFLQLMKDCVKLTIHAGETQSVESIWEAVYYLSADRIGHGLKLLDNPRLMQHFIDRHIVVEMCPSSNYQIVGYKDNYFDEDSKCLKGNIYPLKQYLQHGIKVTVCTDNTGISRTDFSRELLKAARLSPGGLSIWDILVLVRNSFKGAFLPFEEKARLLQESEKEIERLIETGDIFV